MTKTPLKSTFNVLAVFVLALALTLQAFFVPNASAQITDRKLTLRAGSGAPADGGSKPSGVVRHEFEFVPGTAGLSVGSIKFEYCTTAADAGTATCVMPTGLSTTSATSEFQSGATGFTLVNTTNGAPYLTRTAATVAGTPTLVYRLADITNPSTVGTFFVRITMYSTTNATGSSIDGGSVAASTTNEIVLDGTMPESLVFCTGATVDENVGSGVPDCSTATLGAIEFNQLFSPTDTAVSTSQMAASTNAGFGYVITVNGPTLTSGSNTITGLAAPATAASTRGTSSFGLNLRANTAATSADTVALTRSLEVDPLGNGTNYRGRAQTGYNTVDTYKFVTGDVVAASDDNGAGGSAFGGTDAQIFSVTYMANVPGSQPAGTYTSTLTYICTPTF